MKRKLLKSLSIIYFVVVPIFTSFFSIGNLSFSIISFLKINPFIFFILILGLISLSISYLIKFKVIEKEFFKSIDLVLSFFSLLCFVISPLLYTTINHISYDLISVQSSGVYFLLISLFAFLISLFFTFDKITYSTKDIVEMALCVGVAILLDMPFCKIKIVANGGSISFSMLPLLLLSFRKGVFKGFVASAIVFGLITCLFDGYGFMTYPFDYFLGFGSMCIAGLFKNKLYNNKDKKVLPYIILVAGITLSILFRTVFSTISGIIYYKLDFIPSLIYQLTYIVPSYLAVMILMCVLYRPIKKLFFSI